MALLIEPDVIAVPRRRDAGVTGAGAAFRDARDGRVGQLVPVPGLVAVRTVVREACVEQDPVRERIRPAQLRDVQRVGQEAP